MGRETELEIVRRFDRGTTPGVFSAAESEVMAYFGSKHKERQAVLEDFGGVFSREEIERDAATIAAKEKNFAKLHDRAPLLEAIMTSEEVGEAGWFGDAQVASTTRYDDIELGVDHVWQWQEARHAPPISLAVDVTTASDETILRDKLARIMTGLNTASLQSVKYFRSADGKTEGWQRGLPLVVLGLDERGVQAIAEEVLPYVQAVSRLERLRAEEERRQLTTTERELQSKMEAAIERQRQRIDTLPAGIVLREQAVRQLENQAVYLLGMLLRDPEWKDRATDELPAEIVEIRDEIMARLEQHPSASVDREITRLMTFLGQEIGVIQEIGSRGHALAKVLAVEKLLASFIPDKKRILDQVAQDELKRLRTSAPYEVLTRRWGGTLEQLRP